jgi:hypothetical protein
MLPLVCLQLLGGTPLSVPGASRFVLPATGLLVLPRFGRRPCQFERELIHLWRPRRGRTRARPDRSDLGPKPKFAKHHPSRQTLFGGPYLCGG